jgi:hypothetical protein
VLDSDYILEWPTRAIPPWHDPTGGFVFTALVQIAPGLVRRLRGGLVLSDPAARLLAHDGPQFLFPSLGQMIAQ